MQFNGVGLGWGLGCDTAKPQFQPALPPLSWRHMNCSILKVRHASLTLKFIQYFIILLQLLETKSRRPII